MTTYWEIKTSVFNIMDANSDSWTFLPLVWPKINDVGDRICKGIVTSILDEKVYTAGDLWFLYAESFFDIVKPLSLTTAMTTASTTAEFDTTNYLSSWYLRIGWDKIKYTSKTATETQGITVVKTSHSVGDTVEQLYELPSNISQPFTVFLITKHNEKEIPFIDERFTRDAGVWYSIVTIDWVNLLRVIWATQGKILMKYYNQWTDLVDDTDVCILPDRYSLDVLAMIVAWELLYQNEEVDNGATKLKIWYTNLDWFYKYYASKIKKSKSTIKAKQYNYNSLYTWYWLYGKRRNFTTN